MPQPAEALYQLQQVELEARQIQQRLAKIKEELGDNAAVQTAEAAVATASEALKLPRTQVRDLELEILTSVQKIKASEERLYSGNVKNPKEMQEIQQEIDALKARIEQLEEQMLDHMVSIEDKEAVLEQAQSTLEAETAALASEQGDLVDEQKSLRDRFEELKATHKIMLETIPAEDRKIYETMKPRKANRPVALIKGRTCSVCGVEQTLEVERAVKRRDSLVKCENCGRILYLQ